MKPPFRSSHIPARVLLATLFFLLAAALETAQAQVVTLSPASLSFGSVAVGTTSPPRTVTLRNTSTTTALSIPSIPGIVASGNFAQTNTCGTSVAPGGRCVITVTFTPPTLGPFTGSIVITDNAPLGSQTIALTGTGVAPITITPASHNFGSVGENTTSAPYNFTVRNYQTQAAALTISTALPFAQANTCGASLAANSTCSISVTFSPTTAGAQTGSLAVAQGTSSPVTATLTGTGVTPITITPASRAFGSVAQGYTSTARTFTVQSHTTAALALTISSTNTAFAVSGCGASVAANASCPLTVTFAPTTATPSGPQTGSIMVGYTGTGSPQSVTVTGTAVTPLTAQPTAITFSTTRALGTPSLPHSVTITNRATSPVAIGSIVASPAAYAITGTTCTSSLDAAASCTVTVVFTPAVVGTTTGTLTIPYGTANSQLVVSMMGGAQVNNLVSLVITVPNASIPAGISEQLTATGTYGSGATGNVTSVASWSSSNSTIATVNASGLVTGVSAGTAVITATVTVTNNGTTRTVTNTASVTVTPKIITALSVSAPLASIYPLGTDQFTATATYSNGTSGAVQATFVSSSPSVATISPTGLATGVLSATAGTTNITASVSGGPISPPFLLTVPGVASVAVAPLNQSFPIGLANAALPFGPTNNTVQFTATAMYTDTTTASVTSVATWTSSTVIATINSAGLATALTKGSTTITASFAASGSSLLTVLPPVLESVAVCLGPYPSTPCGTSTVSVGATLGLNATQQFSAVGTYSDNSTQNLTNTATWAAADPQVTVSNAGLAKVVATDDKAHAITASFGTVAPYLNADTGWITASSTAPISCPTPTIDMKLLVVNNAAAAYADFPAIKQILDYVGTPYDVVDVAAAAPILSDGACHGYYQGVIYAFGEDIYTNPALNTALTTYEKTFKVRRLNWYTNPTPDFGFNNYTSSVPSTGTDSGTFTPAAAPVFFYANTATPVAISNAFVYLTTPTTPSGGGTVTPLLVDSGGYTLSGITNFSDGREYLSQMFDSNPYLTHDLVLAYGLLNWVTKGVFLGDYHVYATQQVDDFFIDDSEWIPSTTCLMNLATKDRTAPDASNLPVFRVDSADMTRLVAWQQTKQADPLLTQFKLTMAFNGVGTVGNGDWTGLTAPIISSSAGGGVASFTAQSFSGLPGQSVTVANSTNSGGVLNGTYTIVSVTSSAATTPGTTTFTVSSTATVQPATENRATASVADDLVANLQSYQGAFHWISHTYDHPSTLNGLCKSDPISAGCGDTANAPNYTDDIDLEILMNRWVAPDPNADPSWGLLDKDQSDIAHQLGLTDFNPANIVTPGITGLNDPNVPTYLFGDGIQYAVSDTSVIGQPNNGPNPSPNVGIVSTYNDVPSGIYEVPRHPNDIFYNAATWADDQAEFVCIYSNYVAPTDPPGTQPHTAPPFNTYNAAQILDFTSSIFVTNMLMGDMDPEMFHQPDLHFSDNYASLTSTAPSGTIPTSVTNFLGTGTAHVSSLISDTYDLTFAKYEALYNLPVLSPTLDQMGLAMQSRNSYNLSGVTASISGAPGSQTISITVTNAATIPVTGLNDSNLLPQTGLGQPGLEVYDGQNISHINMTPGTITVPLP